MNDPNRRQLIAAAEALRPLLGELVFVGGSVTGLLITDEAAAEPRATLDVDAIVEITSYVQYCEFGERLRTLGFTEDSRQDAPLCRWLCNSTILDVMPLDESVLGFSNCWYKASLNSANLLNLSDVLEIRVVSAPCFIATKLEAFKAEAKEISFSSRDLKDLVSVVDGRSTLVSEVDEAPAELRAYIQDAVRNLLSSWGFMDALPGHLRPDAVSQSRINIVLSRLEHLAGGARA